MSEELLEPPSEEHFVRITFDQFLSPLHLEHQNGCLVCHLVAPPLEMVYQRWELLVEAARVVEAWADHPGLLSSEHWHSSHCSWARALTKKGRLGVPICAQTSSMKLFNSLSLSHAALEIISDERSMRTPHLPAPKTNHVHSCPYGHLGKHHAITFSCSMTGACGVGLADGTAISLGMAFSKRWEASESQAFSALVHLAEIKRFNSFSSPMNWDGNALLVKWNAQMLKAKWKTNGKQTEFIRIQPGALWAPWSLCKGTPLRSYCSRCQAPSQ